MRKKRTLGHHRYHAATIVAMSVNLDHGGADLLAQPHDAIRPIGLLALLPCRTSHSLAQPIALGRCHVCMHRGTLAACTPPFHLIKCRPAETPVIQTWGS